MKKISFPARIDFYKTLKQRVEQYFSEKEIPKTGNKRMFVKTAFILIWFTIGGVIDMKAMFKQLTIMKRDDSDDGFVVKTGNR